MRFSVVHRTVYEYLEPASESVGELRICPRSNETQRVLSRTLVIDPDVKVSSFDDLWGNRVEFFSIPFRHDRLLVESVAELETFPQASVDSYRDITVAEARQVLAGNRIDLYDFLRPSRRVPTGSILRGLGRTRFMRGERPLLEFLLEVNSWIHANFRYVPGATDVGTPVGQVIESRAGVCQDFAHLMLSIVRTAGLPARYVSGYIEAIDPDSPEAELVGAAASHAWVEVGLPGGVWWGLDPTNNQCCGERHVKVAVGRDYDDVAPIRGTYKGVVDQKLKVMVSVNRE